MVMPLRPALSATLLVSLTAAANAQVPPQANLRLPDDVVPKAQRLEFELDPRQSDFRGMADIDVHVTGPHTSILLNARDLVLTEATVAIGGGKSDLKAKVTAVDEALGVISMDLPQAVEGDVTLSLSFHAPLRTDLVGLYRGQFEGASYIFSQFEPVSARQAFPCFDEPRFKIPFEVTIDHNPDDRAIFNTLPADVDKSPGLTKEKFAPTRPLPTYLLAFAVGPLDVVDGPVLPPAFDRKTPLPIRGIAARGQGPRIQSAVYLAAQVLLDEEKTFGIGYPYDKLDVAAVPDFVGGAMENAGLVTFSAAILTADEHSPIAVQKDTLDTLAHEFAHQWFGDLVTMGFWDDLWLNESFATWFAARTVQRLRPDFDGDFSLRLDAAGAVRLDGLATARRIREPIRTRGDIDAAFDGITYSKGAAVLGMFEHFIDRQRGAGTFMRGVTAYLNAHRDGIGSTADFLGAVSKTAGLDIGPAFTTFLDQPGVPLVQAACVDGKPMDRPARMVFHTTRYLPVGSTGSRAQSWDFPICIVLPGPAGAPAEPRCVLMEKGEGPIPLDTERCPAAVHPNADGAGYQVFTMPPKQLAALGAAAARLTPGERLSLATSLRASVDAATVPFGDALRAASALAQDTEPAVAQTARALLGFAHEAVESEAARARVDSRMAALYEPGLKALGDVERDGEAPRQRELRALLFGAAVEGRAPDTLRRAIVAGRELFATGTTVRVAPDLWPAALDAAVADGSPEVGLWDAWLAAAKRQSDKRMQGWMLGALGTTHDPALSVRALAMSLDAALPLETRLTGLMAQAADRRTRDAAFRFVTENWDALVRDLPEEWRPFLVSLFGGACSADDAQRIETFFRPKVTAVSGLDRSLAETLERVQLCVARKAAHAKALKSLFN